MSAEIVIYDEDAEMAHKAEDIKTAFRERDILASAIAEAAVKTGIYNGEVQATGPHLLMFLDDMVDYTKHLENELATLVTYNKALEKQNITLAVRDCKVTQHIKNINSAKSLAYRDAQLEELIRVWESA